MNFRSIAVAAIVTLVVAGAFAQPAQPPRPGAVLASYLRLTPEQIASWKQIHSDEAATIKPLVANARDLRDQLAAAVKSATPDPAAVGNLTLQLAAAREQVRAAREATKTNLEAVLTAEQKTKFEAFRAAVEFLKQRR